MQTTNLQTTYQSVCRDLLETARPMSLASCKIPHLLHSHYCVYPWDQTFLVYDMKKKDVPKTCSSNLVGTELKLINKQRNIHLLVNELQVVAINSFPIVGN